MRAVGDEGAARGRYRIAAAGDIACSSDPGADASECRDDDTAVLVVDAGFTSLLAQNRQHPFGNIETIYVMPNLQ